MHENRNKYCCHCLTKIQDPGGDFCSECGKRHSVYYGQSYELPAGTYLSGGRYFVGKCIGSGGFGISYINFNQKGVNHNLWIRSFCKILYKFLHKK